MLFTTSDVCGDLRPAQIGITSLPITIMRTDVLFVASLQALYVDDLKKSLRKYRSYMQRTPSHLLSS